MVELLLRILLLVLGEVDDVEVVDDGGGRISLFALLLLLLLGSSMVVVVVAVAVAVMVDGASDVDFDDAGGIEIGVAVVTIN